MVDPKQNKRNQVEAIIFKRTAEGVLFLMLKRNSEKGCFWQPVTGKVEGGESFVEAARREVREELSITSLVEMVDTEYFYEFNANGEDQFEYILGVEIPEGQEVTLSPEHTEYAWATKDQALNTYLKYPGNKEGLRRLCAKLHLD